MRRGLVIGGVVAIAAFTVVSLLVYDFHPTAGTVLLSLGWVALLGSGYLLVRAASAFDLRVGPAILIDGVPAVRRGELEREKKLLLKAIKECEFDRDSGKLDGGMADEAIARYRARALEILRLLDDGAGKQYEAAIEKELAKRLDAAAKGPLGANDDPGPRGCSACTTPNDDDAAFCKKCGAKLEIA